MLAAIAEVVLESHLQRAADCASLKEAEPYAAAIDGTDGTSWHLPLEALSSSSLEPHAPGDLGREGC